MPGCSCKRGPGTCSRAPFDLGMWPSLAPQAASLRRRNAECEGSDILLGISVSLPLCLQLCREVPGCRFVAYGVPRMHLSTGELAEVGRKRGQCHWEVGDCLDFEDDFYMAPRHVTERRLDSGLCRPAAFSAQAVAQTLRM